MWFTLVPDAKNFRSSFEIHASPPCC
uniref:Uncharacterized protein n=1 Tax=Anguilla anguilla TaxID=7936 RepID=A0A0E9TJ25_ANGAN